MVHYAGEEGIDMGAFTKEYLSETISNISSCVFNEGAPIDSMLYVHNGYFRICGEITVVSLVNGGPPPCFFEENIYKILCDPNSVDLQNLSMKEHLTSKEVEKMTDVENNPTEYRECTIENGYTSFISPSNISDIIGTVLVSIESKRLTCLKEFYAGLELLGFGLILKSNSELLKPIFVGQVEEVVANFLVASIKATFSELGTNKRNIEEVIIDYLQDTIISLEYEEVAEETEQLAYLQTNDCDCGFGESVRYSDVIGRVKSEMSAVGVFQWLTGQRHKPVNGEKIAVKVEFDHDCLERNPQHSICFLTVGACGRVITIPVAHMNSTENIKKVFFTAYCKGQVFSRR